MQRTVAILVVIVMVSTSIGCLSEDVKQESEIYGCSDSTALNYNPNATNDDGSCYQVIEENQDDNNVLTGCTNPQARNFIANATEDDGSCDLSMNVILMIGDGMGWEMVRAAAIYSQINSGIQGNLLTDFYTSGKGNGLTMQELSGFQIATTYSTTVDGSKKNSLRVDTGSNTPTASEDYRDIEFDPRENLVRYDPNLGGASPWDSRYYHNDDSTSFDPLYITYDYPDSAQTATTLMTGVKTFYNAVGVDLNERANPSLGDIASDEGMCVGISSNVPITHATPASAFAKINSRYRFHDGSISNSMDGDDVLSWYDNSDGINILLGTGNPNSHVNDFYVPSSYLDEFTSNSNNTLLLNSPNSADALHSATSAYDSASDGKILGLYGGIGQANLPYSGANGSYDQTGWGLNLKNGPPSDISRDYGPLTKEEYILKERDENPTLAEMSASMLEACGDDEQGFFLTIESGDIDWAAHSNNLDALIGSVIDFDKAVATVVDWIEKNGGWERNMLVITADHDHYLTLTDSFPELIRNDNALNLTLGGNVEDMGHFWGPSKSDPYGGQSHTNRPVPVFFQGDCSKIIDQSVGEGFDTYGYYAAGVSGMIDQVHIHLAMKAALMGHCVD
ncbi:MAG TPA: alkaline phosphatase [Candidatus Thalassarchaeaceae archaeon]|nr:MAG TPA: alkaline phosphatase [Candidatus Poseidoniales archaeon]HIH84338.1 alkaline phosphatase [Candidatus Thalassarchaeaceae archaeon]